MYQLQRKGLFARKYRLTASEKLGSADFRSISDRMGRRPMMTRKVGLVAARRASAEQRIETRWNGKETSAVARPGDWIVTSLRPDGAMMRDSEGCANTYVIRADTFPRLYDRAAGSNEMGDIYRSKSVVQAMRLEQGFDILAPWGERQTAPAGYLILNGEEVYGNNRETFEAAYEIVG
jgi:hypothetical protein